MKQHTRIARNALYVFKNSMLNVFFLNIMVPHLQWTGISSMMYSHPLPSVPGVGSRFTATLTRIKWLLKRNNSVNCYLMITSLIADELRQHQISIKLCT